MRPARSLVSWPCAALGALLACGLPAARARAQPDDDWSLTRPPPTAPARRAVREATATSSTAAVRDRQRRVALDHPSDELAFEQLRAGELARTGGLAELSSWLRETRARGPHTEAAQLLLARVHASEGRTEDALAELSAVLAETAAPEEARRLRVTVLRELGRWSEAAEQLELLASSERRPVERATLWRAVARERLRSGAGEAALRALSQARERLAGQGLVARQEQRALELEAYRATGKLAELALQLMKENAWEAAARVWEELGDVDQAVVAYRKALAASPAERAPRIRLARLLAERGQLEAAEREACELVRRWPSELEPALSLAELLRAAGRRADALAQLAALSRRVPRDLAVQRALHHLYERWGEPLLAERALERVVALSPSAPEQRIVRADRALALGERAHAVGLLRGEHAGSRTAAEEADLADLFAERDLLPEALEHSERALRSAPGKLAYLRAHASLLERSGRATEAELAWSTVLEHADADRAQRREARQHLVSSWSRAGTVVPHISELRARAATSGLDAAAVLLLAELYARDPQQLPAQVALLERRLAEAPGDLDALLALARAHRQQGDPRGALATWQRVLTLREPEAAGYAREALQAALESAHEPRASELVELARAIAPHDPSLQRMAGDFYAARAERARARDAYARALTLDPADTEAALALAAVAFDEEDTARGRSLVQSVLLRSEDESRVREAVGLSLRRDPTYTERSLLDASRGGVAHALLRRLVFEYWADLLPPEGVDGAASGPLPLPLTTAVRQGLGMLLEALVAGTPGERDVALRLLTAVPMPEAREPLLAVAEAPDRPQRERAAALIALGQLRAALAGRRLLALHTSAPRALRPFVLWALCTTDDPRALQALQQDVALRARGQRALAVVLSTFCVAADRPLATTDPATSALLDAVKDLRGDPDVVVRAAVDWAGVRSGLLSEQSADALRTGGSQALLALAARVGRADLAQGLFVADPRVQELTADYLSGARRPLERAPAPRWPFAMEDYLARIAGGAQDASVGRAVPRELFASIAQALVSGLSGDRFTIENTLRALSAHAGGVLPSALLASGCAPSGLSGLLAQSAEDRLVELLMGPDPTLRGLAVAPLVLGGAAGRDEVLGLLEREQDDRQLELLRVLARLPALPPRLRPAVERLATQSPSWPTRMWATRALHDGAAADREQSAAASESVALVRAAAHTDWGVQAPSPPTCETEPPATN